MVWNGTESILGWKGGRCNGGRWARQSSEQGIVAAQC
jgi:hypothetical protein